jgi:hypothetical protein
MRSAAQIRSVLPAIVLALLAVPTAAAASPLALPFPLPAAVQPQLRTVIRDRGDRRSDVPFRPRFVLKAHNGYRVGVIGIGNAVLLEVVGHHGGAATAYVARGTVTSRRLQATFGELGSVAMRFRPSSSRSWQKPQRHCHGAGRFIDRPGVFVGDLRFRGEDGYVSVHAHRVKGRVSSIAPQCDRAASARRVKRASAPSSAGSPGPESKFLSASWRHGVASGSFAAIGKGGLTIFFASTQESEGRLAKLRFAFTFAASKAFAVDDALTFARVSPPRPFVGTGIYRAAPDGTTTWAGSLSVNFPGAAHFPLTGEPFKATVEDGFLAGAGPLPVGP